MNETRLLADFASGLELKDVPDDVVKLAKTCIMDSLGVMLAGHKMDGQRWMNAFGGELRFNSGKKSSIVGSSKRTSREFAALINGCMCEIPELADGHPATGGHPSSAVMPAALAVAEAEGLSGKELIRSVIAGYEVFIRIAESIHPSTRIRGFNSTSTCGSIASAAAVGNLLHFGSQEMTNAMSIAGFVAPLGLSESFFGSVKPIHSGQASITGVISSDLARSGFTGSPTILEGGVTRRGFLAATADTYEPRKITHRIGKDYRMKGIYFRVFPGCRLGQGAVEACRDLMRENRISTRDVKFVTVRVSKVAYLTTARYTQRNSNYVTCQHSLPFLVAVTLLKGIPTSEDFLPHNIALMAEVHELEKKIRVVYSKSFASRYPDSPYCAEVQIIGTNGTVSKTTENPLGDSANPVLFKDLALKFRTNAEEILDPKQVSKVIQSCKGLERVSNIRNLMSLVRVGYRN